MTDPTLWPTAPNWRKPFTVTYEFLTEIITSRAGKEQRRALRSTPRRSLKFITTRKDADVRAQRRVLVAAQGYAMVAPDLSRQARLVSSVAAASSALSVDDATANWLAAGSAIAVCVGGTYHAATVSSRAGSAVTLSGAIGVDVPAGAKLHPLLPGRLDDSIQMNDHTPRVAETDVMFIVDPGAGATADAGDFVEAFNGREIAPFLPNRAGAFDTEWMRKTDVVDFNHGVIAVYQPISFSTRTRRLQLLLRTAEDRAIVVAFFTRMMGRLREFYLPSFDDDFTLVSGGASGANTALFAGLDINTVYGADASYRAVQITGIDGTRFFRRITAAASIGNNTQVSTDVSWPCDLATAQVQWLMVHRFGADALTVDCVTDEVSQVQAAVQTLLDLPVSGPDSAFGEELDGAAQWVLDNWGMRFFDEQLADPVDYLVNDAYPWITLSIGVRLTNDASAFLATILTRYAENS